MKSFNSVISDINLNYTSKSSSHFFFHIEFGNGVINNLFLDENVENVIGYSKEELLTQRLENLKFFDSRYLQFVINIFNEATKMPQHFEFETIVKHKNEHIVLLKNKCVSFINPKTDFYEIMGYTELITDLNIGNYSKTTMSKVINIAYNFGLVGTFYYDIKNNTLLWSDEAKKMHGYQTEPTIEEFLKKAITKSGANYQSLIQKVVDSKEGFQSLYKFYREIDNTYRNILCIIFPIIDKNNNLIGLSGNMIDLFDDTISIEPNNNSDQIDKVHPEKDSIFIKHLNQYIKINYNEILAISSLRDYVQIYTTNREAPYTYYSKLYKIKESLPENIFVQTHRSHIVNIKQIDKVIDNNVIIKGLKFPISRNYKAQLKELLK